jgi:aspartate-semialdehyde dehydrogenase
MAMRVGFVGWRGMVGSVLMQRMGDERDFELIDPVFFSTSNAGGQGPAIGKPVPPLKRADDLAALKSSPAREATTPATSTRSFGTPAGTATGSTPPRRCG